MGRVRPKSSTKAAYIMSGVNRINLPDWVLDDQLLLSAVPSEVQVKVLRANILARFRARAHHYIERGWTVEDVEENIADPNLLVAKKGRAKITIKSLCERLEKKYKPEERAELARLLLAETEKGGQNGQ